jgi:hypothetical protein
MYKISLPPFQRTPGIQIRWIDDLGDSGAAGRITRTGLVYARGNSCTKMWKRWY